MLLLLLVKFLYFLLKSGIALLQFLGEILLDPLQIFRFALIFPLPFFRVVSFHLLHFFGLLFVVVGTLSEGFDGDVGVGVYLHRGLTAKDLLVPESAVWIGLAFVFEQGELAVDFGALVAIEGEPVADVPLPC